MTDTEPTSTAPASPPTVAEVRERMHSFYSPGERAESFRLAAESFGYSESWRLWSVLQSSRDEAFRFEQERAMVMLDTWGSTSSTDEPFFGWFWTMRNEAPEWLTSSDLDGVDPSDCMTVLDYSLTESDAPKGWKRVYQYGAGEKTCPWCEGSGEAENESDDDGPTVCCKLCEGDGVLYEGEECQVVVFAPLKWTYGSGMVGCRSAC